MDTSKIPFYGNVRGCGYTKTELLDLEKKWIKEEKRLNRIFKKDLEIEFNLTKHPKKLAIWKFANSFVAGGDLFDNCEIYAFYYGLTKLI